MTKTNKPPERPTQPQLTSTSFFAKYDYLVAELFRTPGRASSHTRSISTFKELAQGGSTSGLVLPPMSRFMTVVDELEKTGFGRLLEAAEREHSPEAFKKTVQVLLVLMGVQVPEGVFTPTPNKGKAGRPISRESERINSIWIERGKPSLFTNEVARAVYGPDFTKASGTDRRTMRDKCRHAVERHVQRELAEEIAKLEKELADTREKTARLQRRLAEVHKELGESKPKKP